MYLTATTFAIRSGRGTPDRYIGDVSMALSRARAGGCDACPPGGGGCAREETRKAVPDCVPRELDLARMNGADRPAAVFEPTGFEGAVPEVKLVELRLWQQVFKRYRAQNRGRAEAALLSLRRKAPEDDSHAAYDRRVAAQRANPPGAGWDVVTRFETKYETP